MSQIQFVQAREILDSRGNPTVFAQIRLTSGISGCASVPSGASTGAREAHELRDGDPRRYGGMGVLKACRNVCEKISPALAGMDIHRQRDIDYAMLALDGTDGKRKLGANAILAVSLAAARAAAKEFRLPLYQYIGGTAGHDLPVPMMNLLNGGAHSGAPLDFQEFMIRCVRAKTFREAVRTGAEIFHSLKRVLKRAGEGTGVGDEGGFAPERATLEQVFEWLIQATEEAGYKPGKDVMFALDCAASEFYDSKKKVYRYGKSDGTERDSSEQAAYLEELVRKYPVDSIEDAMAEDDWDGWRKLTALLGDRIQIVGDDLFTTNEKYLAKGVKQSAANAILIKMNQIGTLTETLDCIDAAKRAGYRTIISHRSGETEDAFLADLAVAVNAGQVKCGSLSRSERTCKYNRLMEIEDLESGMGEPPVLKRVSFYRKA